MVYNKTSVRYFSTMESYKNLDTLKLCELLNTDIRCQKIRWNKRTTPNKPPPFIKLLDPQTFARFQEHLYEFPSFTFQNANLPKLSLSRRSSCI